MPSPIRHADHVLFPHVRHHWRHVDVTAVDFRVPVDGRGTSPEFTQPQLPVDQRPHVQPILRRFLHRRSCDGRAHFVRHSRVRRYPHVVLLGHICAVRYRKHVIATVYLL